jgi:hypothetical protein
MSRLVSGVLRSCLIAVPCAGTAAGDGVTPTWAHPSNAKPAILLALAAAPAVTRAAEEPVPEREPAALALPRPATVYQPSPPATAPPSPPATEPSKNAVFIELLGNSLIFSANYERRLDRAYILRVGTGFVPPVFDTDPWVLTPAATFGRLFGDCNLELAAGGVAWAHVRSGDAPGLFATGVVGYRYQPPGSGLVMRVAFTPFVRIRNPTGEELLNTFWPGGGASIGYGW